MNSAGSAKDKDAA